MLIKLLIFDMDGVLIESVDAKTDAFRQLFAEYSVNIKKIIMYHMENPGVSRYHKIPYIFENIIKEPLSKDKEASLLSELTSLIDKEMVNVPLVAGCENFLDRYAPMIPCSVVSAAPGEDIISILTKKGISHYFSMMLGSPLSKQENIRYILHHYHVSPSDAIMIGDACADYSAAHDIGCRFIGRVQEGHKNPFFNLPDVEYIIRNFEDLSLYFKDNI